MSEPTDKQKMEDLMREFDDLAISRPHLGLKADPNSGEAKTPLIPRSFLDAILEIIAKSIEQTLADVMTRCVGDGVEQKIRPLVEEIALLRIAFEHDWDRANRRAQNSTRDKEDSEE